MFINVASSTLQVQSTRFQFRKLQAKKLKFQCPLVQKYGYCSIILSHPMLCSTKSVPNTIKTNKITHENMHTNGLTL
jgi:hypothetical protein